MAGISLLKEHENKWDDMWQDIHYYGSGVDGFAMFRGKEPFDYKIDWKGWLLVWDPSKGPAAALRTPKNSTIGNLGEKEENPF